jgi:hypothetical protein
MALAKTLRIPWASALAQDREQRPMGRSANRNVMVAAPAMTAVTNFESALAPTTTNRTFGNHALF